MKKIHINFVGLYSLQGEKGKYRVLLKEVNGVKYLPIIFFHYDAYFISEATNKNASEQIPSIYGISKILSERSGNKLRYAIITKIVEDCYHAELVFKANTIECECSDALILALTCGAPVFASEDIIKTKGKTLDDLEGLQEENTFSLSSKDLELQKLREERAEAIEKEEYERAALLTDKIKKMERS